MQMKKGISLIVLVITIIVIIILAGAVVISLNNNGILDRASRAIISYNEDEVNHIAQMAWSEAYIRGMRTEQELTIAINQNLENNNIDISKYVIEVTEKGVTVHDKNLWWLQDRNIVTKGKLLLNVGDRVINYTAGNYTWKVLGAENGKLLLTTSTTIGNKTLYASTANWDHINNKWTKLEQMLDKECEIKVGNLGSFADSVRSIKLEDITRITGADPTKTINYGKQYTYDLIWLANKKEATGNSDYTFKHPDGRILGSNGVESITLTYTYYETTSYNTVSSESLKLLFENESNNINYFLALSGLYANSERAYSGLLYVSDKRIGNSSMWYFER